MQRIIGRIFAALAVLSIAVPAFASADRGTEHIVAFVVQLAAAPEPVASDLAMKSYLEGKGYRVILVDHLAPASEAERADAILISASVSANKLEGRYRMSTKPILVLEPYALPHMGMSGRRENEDFGTKEKERWMWVVNAPHPAAGESRPGLVNMHRKNAAMGWGKPGLGASIIGTLPGEETRVTAFTYEAGATMDYENLAPARRAFFFVDTVGFAELNENGLRMFDAMVGWTVSGPGR